MKKSNYFRLLTVACSVLAITACSKDKPVEGGEDQGNSKKKEKFVFIVTGQGSSESGSSGTYIVTTDDVSQGNLSIVGNGMPATEFSFINQNNHVFGLTYGGQGPITPYTIDTKGDLQRLTDDQVNAETAGIFGNYGEKNVILGTTNRSMANPVATLRNYDAQNFSIANKNTVDLSKVLGGKRMAIWTGVFQVGNKIYIPFQSGDGSDNWGGDFTTTDTTYIGIFSYPELKFEKTIRDGRGSHIGNWFAQQGLAVDDQGDAYVWFSANEASLPTKNKSGFLRIKKGTDEFDKDYYFDIESLGKGKIARGSYLKDNKFLMTIYNKGEQAEGIGGGLVKLYIVGIQTKKMTELLEIPAHEQQGYKDVVYVDKGGAQAYYTCQDKDDKQYYTYIIDINNATAKRGLKFTGISQVSSMSKISY
ncbi:DUF4374 domain-containing protein [uncultured Sphingobacterium sp.]|uniref:DUF4374 domain-containing protein n=1 Tax=uncultured Sphingobacterium sp. TaxID=182688 RepID=UPI0025F8B48E|nr:DUF4374 domain-containing protein [uncultured Sphingobacterium sp.]